MFAKLRDRLTYANVVATLALFIALGGSSYAAFTVTGRNVKNSSLSGKDIKNSSLAGRDVKNNSLTGADLKNIKSGDVSDGSLLAKDFAAGQIPAGPKGDRGLKGDKGTPGTARAYGSLGTCDGTTGLCDINTNHGIASILHATTGTYCVEVTGITTADSVAIVSVAKQAPDSDAAVWRRDTLLCPSQFEVDTYKTARVSVRDTSNTIQDVQVQPTLTDVPFSIAIP